MIILLGTFGKTTNPSKYLKQPTPVVEWLLVKVSAIN